MARNTSRSYLDLRGRKATIARLYETEFNNLFSNACIIENLPTGTPKNFIMNQLFLFGRVAFFNGYFYQVTGKNPLDLYGRPLKADLRLQNNTNITNRDVSYDNTGVQSSDVRIITANALATGMQPLISNIARILANIETSIDVNIANSQTTKIVEAATKEQVATINAATDEGTEGKPVVVSIEGLGDRLAGVDISVPFIADKLETLRQTIWTDTLKRIGIIGSNDFKRERIQTAEVGLSIGEAIDYIYTMIDTFNTECELFGLPFRMRFNGYSDRYDTTDSDKVDTKEVEDINTEEGDLNNEDNI